QPAEALQQSGEQRGLRTHSGDPAGEDEGQARDEDASMPQHLQRLLESTQRARLAQLVDSEREGRAAHGIQTDPMDRGAQIGYGLAPGIQRRGAGYAHEPRRNHGLGRDDSSDALSTDVLVRKDTTDANDDLREPGQLHVSARELRRKRLDEHKGFALRVAVLGAD